METGCKFHHKKFSPRSPKAFLNFLFLCCFAMLLILIFVMVILQTEIYLKQLFYIFIEIFIEKEGEDGA